MKNYGKRELLKMMRLLNRLSNDGLGGLTIDEARMLIDKKIKERGIYNYGDCR